MWPQLEQPKARLQGRPMKREEARSTQPLQGSEGVAESQAEMRDHRTPEGNQKNQPWFWMVFSILIPAPCVFCPITLHTSSKFPFLFKPAGGGLLCLSAKTALSGRVTENISVQMINVFAFGGVCGQINALTPFALCRFVWNHLEQGSLRCVNSGLFVQLFHMIMSSIFSAQPSIKWASS